MYKYVNFTFFVNYTGMCFSEKVFFNWALFRVSVNDTQNTVIK